MERLQMYVNPTEAQQKEFQDGLDRAFSKAGAKRTSPIIEKIKTRNKLKKDSKLGYWFKKIFR